MQHLAEPATQAPAENLFDEAPCAYVLTEPGGRIRRINRLFAQWTGYSAETVVDRLRIQDVLARGGSIFWETHLAPLLRIQGAVFEIAADLVSADGTRWPALMNLVEHRDDAGQCQEIRIAIFRASERRTYERELLAARDRAKAAEADLIRARDAAEEATHAKSAFLANMSHEIRTPMNGVLGVTSLLADSVLNDEQRRYVEIIRGSGEALLALINDILDFSKIEAGRMELDIRDFHLRLLLEETVQLLAIRAAEKGLNLVCIPAQGVPVWLRGDAGRLRQILVNLIGNAIKFTAQGSVTVRTSVIEEQDGNALLRFTVTDTGIGIPATQCAQLFQPFTQADTSITRRYGGTGLGLAIARQLAAMMDGSIGVEKR